MPILKVWNQKTLLLEQIEWPIVAASMKFVIEIIQLFHQEKSSFYSYQFNTKPVSVSTD